MPLHLEDYALIGDCQTAALVGRDGSIDWLCVPRFDSGACFAALLGTPENGRWLLAPSSPARKVVRRYWPGTLVLETLFTTDEGEVALIDFMPPRAHVPDLMRIVEGREGRVRMRMELIIRFDYGSIVPWVRRIGRGTSAIAGPDMLALRTDVELKLVDDRTVANFDVAAGQRRSFDLTWHPSHVARPAERVAADALDGTVSWWRGWSGRREVGGEWSEDVRRSLITLKALTYAPTAGIAAAPTTSLPERLGGVRNWDYRYCWLRDATFALYALMLAGYRDEAIAWREWLLRAVAGRPDRLQIMYGLGGERRLPEQEITWLAGYEGSSPVRVGNGAYLQRQLDVFGEVVDVLHQSRRFGLEHDAAAWDLQLALMDYLESGWKGPDHGIWEVRGPKRRFTHSKVMAWVAFDRAVKAVENFGLSGPADRWRALRDEVHAEVCRRGFDAGSNSFVQAYDSRALDASLLLIPLVGFLPPSDPRVLGTVEAVERRLVSDGFVRRYDTGGGVDGLPPGEGAFLLCTFWLADCLALMGRHADARRVFERLLAVRNDVGLLSESYDASSRRLVGNFPQAFSHIGLINTAINLTRGAVGAAGHRPES